MTSNVREAVVHTAAAGNVDLRRLSDRSRLIILAGGVVTVVALFVLIGGSGMWEYVLPRRLSRVAAMGVASVAIAVATLVFQTFTHNRILSPNIIGLDALFLLVQTIIVYAFGSMHVFARSPVPNFALSLTMMLLFSGVVYKIFFGGERQNVFLILLVGIVFGTFFSSISSFLQVLIDPNEFLIVQDRMFASFNNVQTQLLTVSAVVTAGVTAWIVRDTHQLDVLALGRDQAMSLGIDYEKTVRGLLVMVFVLISVSTALVGPITFLGLIVVNAAYALMDSYRRSTLFIASSLIALILVVGGQLLAERVFQFSAPISVIINLIGGVYFLYLILKETRG